MGSMVLELNAQYSWSYNIAMLLSATNQSNKNKYHVLGFTGENFSSVVASWKTGFPQQSTTFYLLLLVGMKTKHFQD